MYRSSAGLARNAQLHVLLGRPIRAGPEVTRPEASVGLVSVQVVRDGMVMESRENGTSQLVRDCEQVSRAVREVTAFVKETTEKDRIFLAKLGVMN